MKMSPDSRHRAVRFEEGDMTGDRNISAFTKAPACRTGSTTLLDTYTRQIYPAFPAVIVQHSDSGTLATTALALSGIEAAMLHENEPDTPFHIESEREGGQWPLKSEILLRSVATWPASTMLELRWTAWPDIACPSRGVIWVTLFLHADANNRESAIADVIQCFLRLRPMLATCMPYMVFEPISEPSRVEKRYRPFNSAISYRIGHRREQIPLSSPLQRSSLGFGKHEVAESHPETVEIRYPWIPAIVSTDMLALAMLHQMDPLQIAIQIKPSRFENVEVNRLKHTIETCERFLSAGVSDQLTLQRQAAVLRDSAMVQLSRLQDAAALATCFRFSSSAFLELSTVASLTNLILAPPASGLQPSLFEGGFTVHTEKVDSANHSQTDDHFPLPPSESVAAFLLPDPPNENVTGFPVRRWRSAPMLPESVFPEADCQQIVLFDNEHLGTVQPVVVSNDDRMRHMFICGQTGCGKSTLMEAMILQDIELGHGVGVVDPHGDLVESILGRVPRSRMEDVVLLDPLDLKMPMGFNLLEWETIEHRDLIIDELYQSMDRMYDLKVTGGPIFENNFRFMLKLLMGDGQRSEWKPTLLEFMHCYLDAKFRSWLEETTGEAEVKDFVKELERTGGEASLRNLAPYVTSKFGRFVNDVTLRRMVGQEYTSFSFDEIVNKQKIFLVKLGRGRWGSVISGLLANQLVVRIKLAAMKRGGLPVADRSDFFLYVDEAGLIPSHSLAELLSEARKFRLGLVLATQYTKQLTGSAAMGRRDTLIDSVLGNVGTTICFRLGQEDAVALSPSFWPTISAKNIMGLPNFCGYASLRLSSSTSSPFSFVTRPIKTIHSISQAEQIRAYSQMMYGTPAAEVDAQILNRREAWKQGAPQPADTE